MAEDHSQGLKSESNGSKCPFAEAGGNGGAGIQVEQSGEM